MASDLWGDLKLSQKIRTPLSILKEQADLLTNHTKGVIKGSVNTSGGDTAETLVHTFFFIVPRLNSYTYQLLAVHHGIALYPCFVISFIHHVRHDCSHENIFIDTLTRIFQDEQTRMVLLSLHAQATEQ